MDARTGLDFFFIIIPPFSFGDVVKETGEEMRNDIGRGEERANRWCLRHRWRSKEEEESPSNGENEREREREDITLMNLVAFTSVDFPSGSKVVVVVDAIIAILPYRMVGICIIDLFSLFSKYSFVYFRSRSPL